jgi:putative hydrolase of the HAD superfamily
MLMDLRRVKAVLFDIDDTLFDSTRLARMARRNAVKAMMDAGLPLKNLQTGYKLLISIVKQYGPNYDHHFDRLVEELGSGRNPAVVAAGVVAYHNTKLEYLKPDPDVVPTLKALSEKSYKLGIVSNGRAVKQWEKIIRMGVQSYFQTVVISEDVGCEKPDPKIYSVALAKLHVPPQNAMYVGDDPASDILGANRAGLISIEILRKRSSAAVHEDEKPRFTIKRFSELLSILGVNR